MHRRDRGLQEIWTDLPGSKTPLDERGPFLNLLTAPARAVLLLERDQLSLAVRPCGAPGIVKQHQRKQPNGLGLRQQLDEEAAEADCLGREIRPGEVALVVDQI